MTVWDAIVLAGGSARRLGGADKPALELDGASLLQRVVGACADAATVVVVGPARPVPRAVRFTREQPPGAGPVAALAAGLPLTSAPLVAVLAADLPWIEPALPVLRSTVDQAVEGRGGIEVAALVDASGRRNLLAAVWRRAALAAAVERLGDPAGAPVRRLFDGVVCRDIADAAGWGRDLDTWDDLAAARDQTAARSSVQDRRTP